MIKLYTCEAGKELHERWQDSFGAWAEENRNRFEEDEDAAYYSFVAPEEIVVNDCEFETYDFTISASEKVKLVFTKTT